MGSSNGNQYSTQNTGPWQPQQPYLYPAFRTASQLFGIDPAGGRYSGYSKFSPYSVAPNYGVEQQARLDRNQTLLNNYMLGQMGDFRGGVTPSSGFSYTNLFDYPKPADQGIYGTGGGYSVPQIGAQLPAQGSESGVVAKGGESPAPAGTDGSRYTALARYAASKGNNLLAAAYLKKAKSMATPTAAGVPTAARDVTPQGSQQMSGGVQMPQGAFTDWFSAQQNPQTGGGIDIGYDGGYQVQPGVNLPPNAPVVMDLLANAPRYFPGDTVADFNQAQKMGLEMGAQRAISGSDLNREAQSGLEATLRGDYMDPGLNPGLSLAADQIAGKVAREAAMYGRTGSGAHLDTLGKTLTELYGRNYEAERNRQYGGYQMAPGLAASDYMDFDRLFGYGQQGQEQAQNEINADFERYKYTQELPYRQLANYMSMISGNYGSSGMSLGKTTQTPSVMDQIGQGMQLGSGLGGMAMLPFMLSSRRLKENIEPVGRDLAGLTPVRWDWKDGSGEGIGFIAEDVAEVFPEAVVMDEKGEALGIRYDVLAVRLAQAAGQEVAHV